MTASRRWAHSRFALPGAYYVFFDVSPSGMNATAFTGRHLLRPSRCGSARARCSGRMACRCAGLLHVADAGPEGSAGPTGTFLGEATAPEALARKARIEVTHTRHRVLAVSGRNMAKPCRSEQERGMTRLPHLVALA